VTPRDEIALIGMALMYQWQLPLLTLLPLFYKVIAPIGLSEADTLRFGEEDWKGDEPHTHTQTIKKAKKSPPFLNSPVNSLFFIFKGGGCFFFFFLFVFFLVVFLFFGGVGWRISSSRPF